MYELKIQKLLQYSTVSQINLHPFNNVRLLVEVSFLPNILNIPHDYLHKNPTSTYYTLNLI